MEVGEHFGFRRRKRGILSHIHCMVEQQEQEIYSGLCFCGQDTVADPDLELRRVGLL